MFIIFTDFLIYSFGSQLSENNPGVEAWLWRLLNWDFILSWRFNRAREKSRESLFRATRMITSIQLPLSLSSLKVKDDKLSAATKFLHPFFFFFFFFFSFWILLKRNLFWTDEQIIVIKKDIVGKTQKRSRNKSLKVWCQGYKDRKIWEKINVIFLNFKLNCKMSIKNIFKIF